MSGPPGLDLESFAGWLNRERPDLVGGSLTAALIPGGRSNLTYRVRWGEHDWAVRRPPLGHVLPTAHDMVREYTVISALATTPAPVPPPVVLCRDPAVLGAPFYVMDYVDGLVLDTDERIGALSPQTAGELGDELVQTLVALHAVDPAAVGLDGFGRPEGFLGRQVKRWHQQWVASETRPLPVEEQVSTQLAQKLPRSGAPTIVHGDYRLTNVIFDRSLTRIAAIVDWEMATLGDPLCDLGLMHVYHEMAESSTFTMPIMDAARGFRTAPELDQRYGELSGRDLSALAWYVAFGYFKLAVISEGIAARYLQGKTVGEGFEQFGAVVPGLLERAEHALNTL